MSLHNVPAGSQVPDDVNVIIEIPAHADPVKYEVDHDTGAVMVDRFMSAPMFYPCNYGYIPNTLSEDGDPLDVLVQTPHPVISGTVVRCRPVGVLHMADESGQDAKLIAVPVDKLTPIYSDVREVSDLPSLLVQQIKHFFERYKDLEEGKWVKVENWGSAEEARHEILSSIERFDKEEAA